MILYNIHVILFASILLALYLFITHPCIFFIYHQVVQKPFIKFINNGFQTNESLINDLNVPSFLSFSLSHFAYSFSIIVREKVQTICI